MLWWPALALWPGLCHPALAFEVFEGFQVHGFLSQGYFLTTNNNLFGSSERGGSLDFTEIGVNASWVPLARLQFAIQGCRGAPGEAAEGEPDSISRSWTTRRWRPQTADSESGWRVRLPFGLYNDTRDVAFTRPSILLPQSIYFERTRELAISGGRYHVLRRRTRRLGNLHSS